MPTSQHTFAFVGREGIPFVAVPIFGDTKVGAVNCHQAVFWDVVLLMTVEVNLQWKGGVRWMMLFFFYTLYFSFYMRMEEFFNLALVCNFFSGTAHTHKTHESMMNNVPWCRQFKTARIPSTKEVLVFSTYLDEIHAVLKSSHTSWYLI